MTSLSKLSKVYRCIGVIFIALGIFLLIVSIIVSLDGEKIIIEPFLGTNFLLGGLFSLFAGYIGEAIDDIRNNTVK